ncbi:MAG: putative TIM-barrel fold metal-dependent hydrolase [Alphaproteobacteria bacterium]|jgi:predicted TIM-barrel fold metal-dependent hydrolase
MPIVDADAHVIESMETWALVADEAPELMPMLTRRIAGQEIHNVENKLQEEFWVINGRVHNRDRNVGSNTSEESREMRGVSARLKHMDDLEVDVQVLFPTLLLRPIADNARLDHILCRSYNRWLADIWKMGDGRLRWAVVPPLMAQDKLRAELEFGKENGACAVFMRPLECERPLSDEYFFPLYEIAQELDLAICPHLGNGSFSVHDFYNKDTTFTKFKLPMIGAVHSILMAGIPDKFPGLRWGIIEASADWLPFLVNDMRQRALKRGKRLPDNPIAANRVYVTCQTNDDLPRVLECAGDDNIVIGTDYGHSDFSSDIEALRLLRENADLPKGAVDKILWDNARALYGLN